MKINGYFAGQPAVVQFFALLLFILGGNLIASVLGLTLFYSIHGAQASMEQYPDMLRLLQFISAIGTFLVPSLALAWPEDKGGTLGRVGIAQHGLYCSAD